MTEDEAILDIISDENYDYYHEKATYEEKQKRKVKKYLGI